ncbi:MAG: AAA family ATPase [Lachnospiraceae bacterium]|nr:AAA family ATPase [Lachnospiraceae bacterium]
MGTYVNPGNQAFAEIDDNDYVDKTSLISLINKTIGKKNKLTCISRPRRFGKSWAAKMLTAYYDCSCDSHKLFDHKHIARTKGYQDYLNKLNVICLDVSGFISEAKRLKKSLDIVPVWIVDAIQDEIPKKIKGKTPNDRLLSFVEATGKQFVFIIDEWDAMIREAKDEPDAQEAYLNLLRGWFKNSNFTPKAVAAAYMTGILPIKKDGSQSAISDFKEYSILHPSQFAKFTGFLESEVKHICRKYKMPFEEVKSWYDGYELTGQTSIYNPYSVMNAMEKKACESFWGKTSATEGLTDYIKMDFEGLQETVANLIAGSEAEVNTNAFQNDLERFGSKDDVLTLLIHLGYLTYNAERKTVKIPNEEVRLEFKNFLAQDDVGKHWMRLIKRSNKILKDAIAGKGSEVAKALQEIREEQYAPQYYNNEQSLRAIIKYAFLSALAKYVKIEEIPSGKGIADVIFIPTALAKLPAMVVELKWNKTAGGAIEQIKKKKYVSVLKPFEGNIILCGINYDAITGEHTCEIERT